MNIAPAPITIEHDGDLDRRRSTAFTVADSLTPNISSAVTATVMSTAGRLKTAVTGSPPATWTTVPGAALNAAGKLSPSCPSSVDEVAGPADRHGRRAERVLEDQVPADDPGDELAERRVSVGVGGACDRHARGELGIAERGEHARQARQDHGDDDCGTGVRCGRLPGQHEDAGADDGADAEHDELSGPEHPLQAARALVPELLRLDLFDRSWLRRWTCAERCPSARRSLEVSGQSPARIL